MTSKVGEPIYRLDGLKWLIIVAVVLGGIYANSVYATVPFLYRFFAGIGVTFVAIAVALNTAKGMATWSLAKEARMEIRKVVWPTTQETRQTTIIVVISVLFVAFILGGIDWVLNLAIQDVIG